MGVDRERLKSQQRSWKPLARTILARMLNLLAGSANRTEFRSLSRASRLRNNTTSDSMTNCLSKIRMYGFEFLCCAWPGRTWWGFILSIFVIVFILIILLALRALALALAMIHRGRLLGLVRLSVLCGRVCLRSGLASFLSLPPFHLRFFQQSASFCLLFPRMSILYFILLDQSNRWSAEDLLILAELARPLVLLWNGVVIISPLLLFTALTSSNEVFFACSTTSLFGRGSLSCGLLLQIRSGL